MSVCRRASLGDEHLQTRKPTHARHNSSAPDATASLYLFQTRNEHAWMTPQVSQEALLRINTGKKLTPRTKRDKYAESTPAHKKQPQDSNQEAPGSGSSRLPRRLRRAYLAEVPGRSARPQFVATTGVRTYFDRCLCLGHIQDASAPKRFRKRVRGV